MINISGAVKKPFLYTNKIIVKGVDGYGWDFPHNRLLIGADWYFEKYEILSKAPADSVIIDAGCKDGCWLGEVHGIIPPGVLRIGVDPINNGVDKLRGGPTPYPPIGGGGIIFHKYYQNAIDDVDYPGTATFHIFDEPGCNSLFPKAECFSMRNVINTITVSVRSLESILLENVSPNTVIYYLKCDCQGKDANVAKSLKSFLPNTCYVQIECSLDKNRPMYVGQTDYKEDIDIMKNLGFEPVFYVEYDQSLLPEGEILFKRIGLK
jgi:hypothetical protein